MNNFVFPPPPPPPPKAASPANTAAHFQNHNFRGRGQSRGRSRGNHSRGSDRGRGFSRGRGGFRNNNFNSGSSHQPQTQAGIGSSQNKSVPNNTYSLSSTFNGSVPLVNSTPHHIPNNSHDQNAVSRKRKWNETRNNSGEKEAKSKPISKPKVEAPPPVPSFGSPLPVLPISEKAVVNPRHATTSSTKKAKSKANQLGLTPKSEIVEESEESADEEAAYAAKGLPQNLSVEYNGVFYDLNTEEGMKNWLEERKRNWPTTARKIEKEKENRKQEQEFLRRRVEKSQDRNNARNRLDADQELAKISPKREKKSKDPEQMQKSIEKHLAKAEKLRQKLNLHKSGGELAMTTDSPALRQEDGRDGQGQSSREVTLLSLTDQPQDGSLLEDETSIKRDGNPISTPVDELPKPEVESDSSSSDSGSDGSSESAPDEESSKNQSPLRAPLPKTRNTQPICKQFSSFGRCRMGGQCPFRHQINSRQSETKGPENELLEPPKRKTLRQRLVEQEQEAEDRLVLQAIKYLGRNGLLNRTKPA